MNVVTSFMGGVVMTLILALIVPVISSVYISPIITDLVGDNSFLMLSSDIIANLLMWLILIGFMVLLGGTMVLRLCGVFGIVGMIFAYWLLGDVRDAIIPIIMLIISIIFFKYLDNRKKKKNGESGKKEKKRRASKS
jgi:uncharacterized membrane protein